MPAADRGSRVGLCLDCRHARLVRSRAGHGYYRCARSDDDRRYPRYPRLPVTSCDGYEAVEPGHDRADPVATSR